LGTSTRSGLFRVVWHGTLKVGFPAEFQEHVESQMNDFDERGGGPLVADGAG